MSGRPPVAVLLQTPGALLSRSHLRELGLERRAVDASLAEIPNAGHIGPLTNAEPVARELIGFLRS